MNELGEWIFITPLALGILITLGLGLGAADGDGGDLDADTDLDIGDAIDLDHGHSHTHHGSGHHGSLSLLGWGRVPLLLSVAVALLLFGGMGLVSTWFGLSFLFAVLVAVGVTYVFGGLLTKRIGKWIPSLETTHTRVASFVGSGAVITLPASTSGPGLLQVQHENDLYQLNYRFEEKHQFKSGDQVLVAAIDPETKMCTVMDDPTR